jgi:hypothetical protein
MALDTITCADKLHIGDAIAKHLPDLCKIYVEHVRIGRLLDDPKDFNVLLSIGELMFLVCRYAPRRSKDYILGMCKDLGKHQQSRPFFINRCSSLLPAYCARQDDEEDWQGLWCFYEIDENDQRFSLDALHLHAYNQPDSALWHRSKGFLLERTNKAPEDAFRLRGKGIDYTIHALTKASAAYKQNPALQRMSLYWAWECFRLLPVEAKKRRPDLYAAVEELNCYSENRNLKHMLLDRFRRQGYTTNCQ